MKGFRKILFVSVLTAFMMIPAVHGNWYIETVDNDTVGWWSSIAVNAYGTPCIVYCGDYLRYATRYGGSWNVEDFDNLYPAEFTSLTIVGNATPFISYYDPDFSRLIMMWQNGSGWYWQPVDSDGVVGKFSDIAVDDETTILDLAHISYYDETNGDLKYAWQDIEGWHFTSVDTTDNVGQYTSIALDAGYYPHISYYDVTNADLKYAFKDSGGWHYQQLDHSGDVGRYSSILVDGDGYPRISYYDATNGDLKYAYKDAEGWHVQPLDIYYDVGQFSSIAIDSQGFVHISYYDATYEQLYHAFQYGQGWTYEVVDTEGDVGMSSSIALDSDDHVFISYQRLDGIYDLKFATDFPYPTSTPTPTAIPTHTPTPSATPTATPLLPTVTPTAAPPTPSPTPVCVTLGCTIDMPGDDYGPGDVCYLHVHICNPTTETYPNVPVFTILDVYGTFFFAPSFTAFDHYTMDILPGMTPLEVLPPFSWPDNAGNASGIIVYAAMTDEGIMQLFGDLDTFSFGWHSGSP